MPRHWLAAPCNDRAADRVIDDDVNVVPSDALLPVTRLIADALAPNHPFAIPIGVASNYHAAIIVVILLDDAATATFISIIVASIIVDPWTSRTKFDSDLSVSGRPGGDRDHAD